MHPFKCMWLWEHDTWSSELLEAASRTTSLLPSQHYTSKRYPVRQGLAAEQHSNVYGPAMCEHTSSAPCSLLHLELPLCDSNSGPDWRSQLPNSNIALPTAAVPLKHQDQYLKHQFSEQSRDNYI